jgi:hypothetical protein
MTAMAAQSARHRELASGAYPSKSLRGGGEQKPGRLELSVPSPAGVSEAFLTFEDAQCGPCCIPLGKTRSRSRDAPRQTGRNVLVPILPRTYTTPERDPADCALPRADGYVYIFKNGYLWRELKINARGYFCDVNLAHQTGTDRRPATTESDTVVLVPYRVDGEVIPIEMCYSEIQWSWARINALGGMDPEDFRLDPDNLPPMPADQGISEADAAEHRRARMQRIDLSGYESGFPIREADDQHARVENVAHADQSHFHIHMHAGCNIPVVYLDDPVGVARRQVADYYLKEAELRGLLEQMAEHPDYASAVIAYATFFDPQLTERETEYVGNWAAGTRIERTPIGKAAAHLDRALLEDILKVAQRRELRVALRKLKADYVQWLDDNAEPLKAAFTDYAMRTGPEYIELWELADTLYKPLSYDPAAIDAGHDLPQDYDVPEDDPGADYLARVLEPEHPHHGMLFPAREQVDETRPESPQRTEAELPQRDGTFRPAAFALGVAASARMSVALADGARQSVQLGEAIVADFMRDFTQWRKLMDSAETHRISTLVRLGKAANMVDLKGLHLVQPGGALDGKMIIGGHFEVDPRMKRTPERTEFKRSAALANRNVLQIVDLDTNTVVGSQNIRDIAFNRGGQPDLHTGKWNRIWEARPWENNSDEGVARARVNVVVVDAEAAKGQRFFRPDNTAPDAKISQGFRGAGMALPPLLAVFQAVNATSAAQAFQNAESRREVIATGLVLAVALLATAHASIDAVVKVKELRGRGPTGHLAQVVNYELKSRHGSIRVNAFNAAGAGVGAAFSVLMVFEALELRRQGEGRAAIAMGISAAAGLGYSGVLLGRAVSGSTSALLRLAVFAGGGVIGWALLAVSLMALVASAMLTYSPLERWARYGPFAARAENRRTHEYENLAPEAVYQAAMSLFMSPSVVIRRDNAHGFQGPSDFVPDIVVEVYAPGFEVGCSALDIRLTVAKMFARREVGRQEALRPYLVSHLKDPRSGAVIGLRYHYHGDGSGTPYRYRARARHVTADDLVLPTVPERQEVPDHDLTINSDVPGWAYAEQQTYSK